MREQLEPSDRMDDWGEARCGGGGGGRHGGGESDGMEAAGRTSPPPDPAAWRQLRPAGWEGWRPGWRGGGRWVSADIG
uniref:Uncharacterized protein n=1 Tax=Oryza sativa subsp. japonica TaxID=39947 RepID=Q6ZEZ4_ORYSJ|nr:hypothetical protein [Oryza sativa Japonica Group]